MQTRIGAGGIAVSGGERQRIILARALVRRPRILLFDELTNHLDALSIAGVRRMLVELKGTCTVVVVTHHQEIAELADTVLRLEQGPRGCARAFVSKAKSAHVNGDLP